MKLSFLLASGVVILCFCFVAASSPNLVIGGLFNVFDADENVDKDQLAHLGAFLLAIDEINADPNILPNYNLEVAIRSGVNAYGAAEGTTALVDSSVVGIVSAFSDDEALVASKIASSQSVVTLNSIATTSRLGDPAEYPLNIQMIPLESNMGSVLQNIMCQWGQTRAVVFQSMDVNGRRFSEQLGHNKHCNVDILQTFYFAPYEMDFKDSVAKALELGATVFVVYLSNHMQDAMLIEAAFDQELLREGTQVYMVEHHFVSHLDPSYAAHEILAGLVTVEMFPDYALLHTEEGQSFVNAFNSTPSLSSDCDAVTDFTGDKYLKSAGGNCAFLNYSDYASNGNTTLSAYVAITYDAVYVLAQGLHDLCEHGVDCSSGLDALLLETAIITNTSFLGASGNITIFAGEPGLQNYGKGSREHAEYVLYNFNHGSQAHHAMTSVKLWNQDVGVHDCPPSMACGMLMFHTKDNLPASAYPPYALVGFPQVLKVGGLFAVFQADGSVDTQQAESLSAFLLAINHINNKTDGIMDDILPNSLVVHAVANDANANMKAVTGAHYTIDGFFETGVVGAVVTMPSQQAEASNMLYGGTGIFAMLSQANTSEFGNPEKYPYKGQVAALESFAGMVMQHILCIEFEVRKMSVFHSTDEFGNRASVEVSDGTYCDLNVLSTHDFLTGDHAAYDGLIEEARAFGSRVFSLIMSSRDAAALLERGYEKGLFTVDTLVFLIDVVGLMDHFSPSANVKAIMKGVFAVAYFPDYKLRYTAQGRQFREQFVNQPMYSQPGECSAELDNSKVRKLFQSTESSSCGEVNYTEYRIENKTLSPYTGYAYDATIALLMGLHSAVELSGLTNVTGEILREEVIANVTFDGVTGYVDIFEGMLEHGAYARGNREEGHSFRVLNFNADAYDIAPNQSMVTVGVWSVEDGVTKNCYGDLVCHPYIFNTVSNTVPVDTKPDVNIRMSPTVSSLLWVFGVIVLLIVVFCTQMLFRNSQSRHVKSIQASLMYFFLLGAFLGAIRLIAASQPVSDSSCQLQSWSGHLAFGLIFGTVASKNERLAKIFKSGFIKKDVSTQHAVKIFLQCFVLFVLLVVIVATVGMPKAAYLAETSSNQTTFYHYCGTEVPIVQTLLFVVEALFLMWTLRSAYGLVDIPDKYNESEQTLNSIGLVIFGGVVIFPMMYLIGMSPELSSSIASVFIGLILIGILLLNFSRVTIKEYKLQGIAISPTSKKGSKEDKESVDVSFPLGLDGDEERFDYCRKQIKMWQGALLQIGRESDTSQHSGNSSRNSQNDSAYAPEKESGAVVSVA